MPSPSSKRFLITGSFTSASTFSCFKYFSMLPSVARFPLAPPKAAASLARTRRMRSRSVSICCSFSSRSTRRIWRASWKQA